MPLGRAFKAPDGKVMVLQGRALCGDGESGEAKEETSELTLETMKEHPKYEAWAARHICGGLGGSIWISL